MKIIQNIRPSRGFLFMWLGLMYIWGLIGYWGASTGEDCHQVSGASTHCFQTFFPGLPAFLSKTKPAHNPALGFNLVLIVSFTTFMALHALLYQISLSVKMRRSFLWLYFALQGGLVLTVKLVVQGDNIAFGTSIASALYLALLLEAISLFKSTRSVTIVAVGYLALFLFSMSLGADWQYMWQQRLASLGITNGYTALLLLVLGYIVLVVFYILQVRSHTRLAAVHAKLEAAHDQITASAERIEELTLMTERQRIARELHDTLAQSLAGLIRQLDVAEAHLAHQRYTRVCQIILEASTCARTALTEARFTIDDLRTKTITAQELSEAVQEEISHFIAATGILCVTDLAALSVAPAPHCEHVRRAISEGLTNVARHAQARHVWVSAAKSETTLNIEVRDDGIGLDLVAVEGQVGHYGLIGLRERAHLAGGKLELMSTPGTGTTMRLWLPRNNRGASK